jgi:predicted GNAT family acetyltransferase
MTIQIEQKEKDARGIFFVREENEYLAELVYSLTGPGEMTIEHTEVGEKLKGKNVGLQLVTRAVAYAEEKGLKIIPLCPYAASVFRKKPEWKKYLITH